MKNKIYNFIAILCMIISTGIILTGCGNKCQHDCEITRIPTTTMTGEYSCVLCGEKNFEFPKLNDVDYEVEGSNPDFKTYVYTYNNESFEFNFSNFEFGYDSETEGYEIEGYNGSSSSIIIPQTYKGYEGDLPVTKIGSEAFANKTNITAITFPSTLHSIGDGAFSGCSNLNTISFPENLTRIGNYAFNNCSLTNVVIPNSVTSIGYSSFAGCNLQKLTTPFVGNITSPVKFGDMFGDANLNSCVPSNLKEVVITGNYDIKSRVFEDAENIETIRVTGNVNLIDQYAFEGCTNLKNVILSNVVTINGCAFENCSALENIVLPSSLQTIGNAAFYQCNSLENVYYMGNKTAWNQIEIGAYNDNNAKLNNADRYYYSQSKPTVINYLENNQSQYWYFNSDNNPELWEMNFTSSMDNKTFEYLKTEVTITEEYWTMLQAAKAQNALDMFFAGDQTQIDMVISSNTKQEYESALATFASNSAIGLTVSFAQGNATLSQGGQSASPLSYIEVDNEIYYVLTKTKAFSFNANDNTIFEEVVTEFNTVRHIYELAN